MKTLVESLNNELGIYNKSKKQIFIIVKPGALNHKLDIINKMQEAGWSLCMSKPKKLLLSEAKSLYDIHKKEDWYKPLCEYMASDISIGMIFTKPGNITASDFELVGKIKDEIRDEFGESDMRNVMHSSDNLEHMKHEASIYFNIL